MLVEIFRTAKRYWHIELLGGTDKRFTWRRLLLPSLSLALVVLAGWGFFWAVGAGQFDGLEEPLDGSSLIRWGMIPALAERLLADLVHCADLDSLARMTGPIADHLQCDLAEISFLDGGGSRPAQQAHADGMEGAQPQAFRQRPDQGADALAADGPGDRALLVDDDPARLLARLQQRLVGACAQRVSGRTRLHMETCHQATALVECADGLDAAASFDRDLLGWDLAPHTGTELVPTDDTGFGLRFVESALAMPQPAVQREHLGCSKTGRERPW